MTSEEKKSIFKLIQTASDAINGWSDPFFERDFSFEDDKEVEVSASMNSADAEGAVPSAAASLPLAAESPAPARESAAPSSTEQTLSQIAQKIAACSRCPLSRGRTNVVVGEGVSNPEVVVVGEGPGYEEDVKGRPFVGPAGQLLDKMLSAVKLDRSKNCFIANIVKCRPPQNRTPYQEEAEACESFLSAQILALKPKMILCVGSTACKNLLKTADGVNKLRGSFYDWKGIPVAVTYHPSALLRDEALKRPAWEDLKLMRSRLCQLSESYRAMIEQAQ